jgi:hypothetical protein
MNTISNSTIKYGSAYKVGEAINLLDNNPLIKGSVKETNWLLNR